jgi:membrane-associated phospholipid phosphatase
MEAPVETLSLTYRMTALVLTLIGWLGLYFAINRRPVDPARRLDMGTRFDRRTPYLPRFSPVYFSTYIFVLVPFFLLTDAHLFNLMLTSFITISVGSCLVHAALPSKIDRVETVTAGGVSGWMLDTFQKVCKPHGNFPSMHVGLSVPVVASGYLALGPRAGTVTLAWGLLIALSTLFTKQHYILDVLAGLAGGLLVFAGVWWAMSGGM